MHCSELLGGRIPNKKLVQAHLKMGFCITSEVFDFLKQQVPLFLCQKIVLKLPSALKMACYITSDTAGCKNTDIQSPLGCAELAEGSLNPRLSSVLINVTICPDMEEVKYFQQLLASQMPRHLARHGKFITGMDKSWCPLARCQSLLTCWPCFQRKTLRLKRSSARMLGGCCCFKPKEVLSSATSQGPLSHTVFMQ